MTSSEKELLPQVAQPVEAEVVANEPAQAPPPLRDLRQERRENRRFWIKLVIQPALFLFVGVVVILCLAFAQRMGFVSAEAGGGGSSNQASDVSYICPMMCTPPQSEPGRCPVCAMELVPASANPGNGDSNSVQIDPAARRVANIQTAPVEAVQMSRTIRAIGEIHYDEGSLKTISAYVDGRLERLYADYTGVEVNAGDNLAVLYSPELYSGQIEYLLARTAYENGKSSSLSRVAESSEQMFKSARQRLSELGMTETQIVELETAGEANSRLHLCAPISGTVIEKRAVEGEYVTEGQAIYRLADLSAVWLMLELFPDDAATVRYGQRVQAEVDSLPGREFTGRVAFIDPNVDPETRTVGVRVVMDNSQGVLRIGDYATARISVSLSGLTEASAGLYDPDLANKWISPRHPHIVQDDPGACPICGIELVPAEDLGFRDQPIMDSGALVVPRDAVLMAGGQSVVYVEEEPGRFEIRRVELGPVCEDLIVIVDGVQAGEQVAVRGNFLIDSQMQLAGNPSLIDPTKALPPTDAGLSPESLAALAGLAEEDRKLAEQQRMCPVADFELGSMGTPVKVDVNGTPVFLCCEGCRGRLLKEPDKYIAKLERAPSSNDAPSTTNDGLPPIGPMQSIDSNDTLPPIGPIHAVEPDDGLPPIEAPQEVQQ